MGYRSDNSVLAKISVLMCMCKRGDVREGAPVILRVRPSMRLPAQENSGGSEGDCLTSPSYREDQVPVLLVSLRARESAMIGRLRSTRMCSTVS